MKDRLVFDTSDVDSIAASDSVGAYLRSADGTLLTSTDVDGKQGLDVNVINTLNIISPANKEEDTPHVSGDIGNFMLAVRADADGSLVSNNGDYAPLQVDEDGFLKVAGKITVEAGDAEYLEDTPHNSGDAGIHILAVRQDNLATLVGDDGDYASLKVDSVGRLYTTDSARANSAVVSSVNTLDVANTAEPVVSAALANRRYLWVYNNDNQRMFIGAAGVTANNGFPVSPGAFVELRLGPSVNLNFVSAKLNHEIRTLEAS